MPFMIITMNKPDCESLRTELRTSHLDYLERRQEMLLAGGALLDENGKPVGGLTLIDTEDQQVAERFAHEDPFQTGQLFASVQIMRWRKSFFSGRKVDQ
jgi:uncharacterized protein YciI